jgi:hypothetical protein
MARAALDRGAIDFNAASLFSVTGALCLALRRAADRQPPIFLESRAKAWTWRTSVALQG